MISSLKGIVQDIFEHSFVLDVAGVGYEVFSVPAALQKIHQGDELLVYTHHHVREDAQALYGFASSEERMLFRKLINVSGIGPKSALAALSAAPLLQLIQAIQLEDHAIFQGVSGIGPKTAKRLVMELRNAVEGMEFQGEPGAGGDYSRQADLLAAMEQLGYPPKEILPYLKEGDWQAMSLDEAIRSLLQKMRR